MRALLRVHVDQLLVGLYIGISSETKLVVVRREDRNKKHGSVALYIAMGIGLRQNLFVP